MYIPAPIADNIQIDNSCPPAALWYQYTQLPAIVSFFDFLQSYWQSSYFDFIFNAASPSGTAVGEMSIINSATDYLFYYAANVLGIPYVPNVLNYPINYDEGFIYDDPAHAAKYDQFPIIGITQPQFQTLLKFIFNWSRTNWTMPALFDLISQFTGVAMDNPKFSIVQDSTSLNEIVINLPATAGTTLFQSMMEFYPSIMAMPYGVTFVVALT